VLGTDGLARRGLLLRHLVLPDDLAATDRVMAWVVRHLSPDTYVNVMGQYRPCGRAGEVPALGRRPRSDEIRAAVAAARAAGLRRLDNPH
jgi:putative pyruvate formate lyase activating enzyme